MFGADSGADSRCGGAAALVGVCERRAERHFERTLELWRRNLAVQEMNA